MPPLPSTRLSFPLNSPLFYLLPSTSLFPNLIITTTTNKNKFLIPTMSFSSSPSSPSPSSISNPKEPEHPRDPEDQELLLQQVLKYHNQTKHHFTKYARGPHWASTGPTSPTHFAENQNPNSSSTQDPLYSSLFLNLPPPKPISKSTISQFFYDSLALSAWKTAGFSTWSLRVNPSSGNLHPTEAYIISPPIESLSDSSFVAHYAPKEHALELRAEIPSWVFTNFLPKDSFLIGLSSIFWREAWKYGERGFRYCNHDVGHAIAAVSMAAAGLGWDVKLLDGLGYEDLEKLMGLEVFPKFQIPSRPVKGRFPEMEFEHPDCILVVFPNGAGEFDVNYKQLSLAISEFSKLEWKGKPNLLSKEHICWDIIYRTAEAVKKEISLGDTFLVDPFQSSGICSEDSFALSSFGFSNGGKQKKPLALSFRGLPWDAEVHAALFVHRVEGLPQGLYFLVRNEEHLDKLKKSMRSGFKWVKPEGCPENLPLYELDRTDCRTLAERLSCHQEIASHGCFSLGMVACFDPILHDKNAWMYPRLFWETGVLGQVLYLEAHAVGISATGIGCYFDDPVHELLGLKGSNFQSLYHFTVGGPVIDKRIMSLPAYPGPDVDA
ncbi:uncharacterized protein Pyn_12797 [Prunus yedoensis var. nudiflora]|uniref:Nitroreductase domain-containing protein n=1 Tax=Prunus yedoensis var. nudiflora TaxID=2094558 RepID=A0A314XMY3_PRUYE|nr:uncharacterized protein Pyn_12797 [Prunus yedoensis var. nudiflora]